MQYARALPDGSARLVAGLAYSLVVLRGAQLFEGTELIWVTWAHRPLHECSTAAQAEVAPLE